MSPDSSAHFAAVPGEEVRHESRDDHAAVGHMVNEIIRHSGFATVREHDAGQMHALLWSRMSRIHEHIYAKETKALSVEHPESRLNIGFCLG